MSQPRSKRTSHSVAVTAAQVADVSGRHDLLLRSNRQLCRVSNFAPYGVALDGLWWPTVEHYFQAQKFDDAVYCERIRRANRPKEAKVLGMTRQLPLRHEWEAIKEEVMLAAVRMTFRTHETLGRQLLSTGERLIVENAPMDPYWGCGPNGSGLNKLGRIIMQVQSELRS